MAVSRRSTKVLPLQVSSRALIVSRVTMGMDFSGTNGALVPNIDEMSTTSSEHHDRAPAFDRVFRGSGNAGQFAALVHR